MNSLLTSEGHRTGEMLPGYELGFAHDQMIVAENEPGSPPLFPRANTRSPTLSSDKGIEAKAREPKSVC